MARVRDQRLDRSVALLARALDLAVRTRQRIGERAVALEILRLRLSAAGASAAHLHLPPPSSLL